MNHETYPNNPNHHSDITFIFQPSYMLMWSTPGAIAIVTMQSIRYALRQEARLRGIAVKNGSLGEVGGYSSVKIYQKISTYQKKIKWNGTNRRCILEFPRVHPQGMVWKSFGDSLWETQPSAPNCPRSLGGLDSELPLAGARVDSS